MAATVVYVVGYAFYAVELYWDYLLVAAVYLRANYQSQRAASRARRNLASLSEGGRSIMMRQPLTARRTLYGINRVSGPITLMHVSASKNLYILITLSAHPVHAIDDVYLNDEILNIDYSGTVLGKFYGNVVVKKGLGTPAGDADLHAFLIAENLTDKDGNPLWTTNHLQDGCAKILVRLAPKRGIFPTGVPNISAVVRGKEVYDPRTATTSYSANAALCIRDYLVDPDQLGATASEIDDAGMITQADICDELVTGKAQPNTFIRAQIPPSLVAPVQNFTFDQEGTLLYDSFYGYRVTFYDAFGETTGSPMTNMLTAGSGSIGLTQIATGGAGTIGRKIYRNGLLAGTISDNTTTVFIDDGSVTGAAIPTVNTTDVTDTFVRDTPLPYLVDGDPVELTTTGTLPAPYALATIYYYIYINNITGKIATTKANALAGIGIVRTTSGSGEHTISRVAETRYMLHGPIDSIDMPRGALEAMLTSCAGKLTNPGGIWTLLVASWRAPTITLDENDLDGPIKVIARLSKRELANGVKGTFVDPGSSWQPTDYPPTTNAIYKAEDNGERLWQDIELPFTLSPSVAQRLSKITLERIRQQISTVWPCKLSAYRVQVGEVVNLTYARFGWSAKPFEVVDLKFAARADGDSPRLGVDLILRETAAGVYDWNSGEETLIDLAPNTNLPNPNVIDKPENLTAASGTQHLYLRNDGTVFSRVKLTWTPTTDAYVLSYGFFEIEYRKQSSLLLDWEKNPAVPGTESSTYVLDVEDSVAYLFRVRAVNNLGVRSTWVSLRHVVVGKTEAPSNVVALNVAQNGNTITADWDKVVDIDVVIYNLRYNKPGAIFSAMMPLTTAEAGTSFTTTKLPPGTWRVGIKAQDSSGNVSAIAAYDDITVYNVQDVIVSVPQAPDWSNVDYLHYFFRNSLNGFSAISNCNLTVSNNYMTVTATGYDPIFEKATSFDGLTYRYIIARIKRTATTGWAGECFYATGGHGYSASFVKAVAVPAEIDAGFVYVVWDMHSLDAGGTDWRDSTITSIRLDFADADGSVFQVESVHLSSFSTPSNFVKHPSGVLIPDSTKLASEHTNAELFEQYVPYPQPVSVYEAPEIDVFFDDDARAWTETAAALGRGQTGELDFHTELDHRLSSNSYDGFENWAVGIRDARYFKFRDVMYNVAGSVGYLQTFTPTLDQVEFEQSGTGIMGASGTVIVFDLPYHNLPYIEVDGVGGAALIPAHDQESTTGFRAFLYTLAGAVSTGSTFNWKARGI